MLLAASEVFGVDAPDGRGLAGAVVLTRWGPDYASVGMMLVAARYGRRGLGRALMEHLLAAAGEGATVTLFATEMGRPLYEKLGFEAVRRNVSFAGRFRLEPSSDNSKRHRGLAPPAASPAAGPDTAARPDTAAGPGPVGRLAVSIRDAARADMPAILAVDHAAFGADRARILTRLPGFADRIAVLEDGGSIVGYAAAWRNGVASTVVGPLVAPDGEAARRLIAAMAARVRTAIRLDLDPDRQELPGWAQARGLEPVSRSIVMVHGALAPRGTPDHLFTPISVALA